MSLAKIPWIDPVKKGQVWGCIALAAVILLFGLIRIRLLNFPLERDEGEYAYGGQLILRGIAPYQLCYTMKLPGTAAAYALIEAVFGSSGPGIHLGFLLVNSATIVLMFLLGRRLFGALGGVVASATYGLLSATPAVLGFSAHATHFVVLPALGGTLLLLRAKESQRAALFFWSGFLLGLAPLMKQPGAFFVLFGIFWVACPGWPGNRNFRLADRRVLPWRTVLWQIATLLFGAILPFGLTCVVLLRAGAFRKFWFWTFSYAREYGTSIPLWRGMHNVWAMSLAVAAGAFFIWLLALLSPIPLWWDAKTRRQIIFLGSFSIFSFVAVCLGFHARNHYFVLVLPAVSLLCAGAVSAGTNLLLESGTSRKWAALPAAVFFCSFVLSLLQKREFYLVGDPVTLCRKVHGPNPFPEALQISEFIKNHSGTGERVAVIGSEPEIYFESDRLSATGYMYTYPLMEAQPFASMMQKEMISEVEAAQPRFVVYVDCWSSWLSGPDSDQTVFEWVDHYVRARYHLVGIVDEVNEGTEYHWGDAATYQPRSKNRLFVYESDRERQN